MDGVYKVTKDQYPVVLKWLEKYLPNSWNIYGVVREYVMNRWSGQFIYTVGWPEIKLAAIAKVDESDEECNCLEYYKATQLLYMFAPDDSHLKTFLDDPDIINWERPVIFQGIPRHLGDPIFSHSKARGNKTGYIVNMVLMTAEPDSVSNFPTPDNVNIRPIDTEDGHHVASSWILNKAFTDHYIKDIIRRLPTFGVYSKDGKLLAFGISKEDGCSGLLYVEDEARGKGYAKIITSKIAEAYSELKLPVGATMYTANDASIKLHEKLGFKTRCIIDWIWHCREELSTVFTNKYFREFKSKE